MLSTPSTPAAARCTARRCGRSSETACAFPTTAKLIVIVVGDEAGEAGAQFARASSSTATPGGDLRSCVNVDRPSWRGSTVRDAAAELRVPYSEVAVEQFDDPYQVTRVLRALLDAPVATGTARTSGWVEKVMATPLLAKP